MCIKWNVAQPSIVDLSKQNLLQPCSEVRRQPRNNRLQCNVVVTSKQVTLAVLLWLVTMSTRNESDNDDDANDGNIYHYYHHHYSRWYGWWNVYDSTLWEWVLYLAGKMTFSSGIIAVFVFDLREYTRNVVTRLMKKLIKYTFLQSRQEFHKEFPS